MKVVVVYDDNDREEHVSEQVDMLSRWGGCSAPVDAQHKATLGCPCVDAGSPREYCWVAAAPNCRFQKPNRSDLR